MGTIRSDSDHTDAVINGVRLGQPARATDADGHPVGPFRWDDAGLPNGSLDDAAVLTLDEPEL
jgi:hypothetical protein